MQYLLSGIETHPDFGFGITADSYHTSAEYLMLNKDSLAVIQQAGMPMNFLFRHSIELYLKSLIIIMHKALKLPYGEKRFDSDKPMILVNEKWVDLFSCHWIDDLFAYWLNHLLVNHAEKLSELAPKGDWREYKIVTELFPIITKYDRDSSYFRYPITKSTKTLDNEKHTMLPISVESLNGMPFPRNLPIECKKKGGLTFIYKNEENQITGGFYKNDDVLAEVTEALQKVSEYLFGMHSMSRRTLCDGQ